MLRILTLRVLTALIGLCAGLAAPATALAHGFEHARAEHVHVDENGRSEDSHSHDAGPGSDTGASIAAANVDHPHVRCEAARTARADAWSGFIVVSAVLALVLPTETTATPPVSTEQVPCVDGSGSAPPRLRAPPIR